MKTVKISAPYASLAKTDNLKFWRAGISEDAAGRAALKLR